jgi:glucose dehydrogenase
VSRRRIQLARFAYLLLLVAVPLLRSCEGEIPPLSGHGTVGGWPYYGGNSRAQRYSPLDDIGPTNVAYLEEAWRYRSGDMDPETGRERWVFDPEVDLSDYYVVTCRGVSFDEWPELGGQRCAKRIFLATLDVRLIALDADMGRRCQGFGNQGEVDLTEGMGVIEPGEYSFTSPAAVADHRLIIGALVLDNRRTNANSGVVRAIDGKTGEILWAFNSVGGVDCRRFADRQEALGSSSGNNAGYFTRSVRLAETGCPERGGLAHYWFGVDIHWRGERFVHTRL